MKPFIDQSFWSDPDIERAIPNVKLAALWLITNTQTSILGVCSASSARFTFETGLPSESLEETIKALPRSFIRYGSVVFLRNYMRHQFGSGETLTRNNFFKALRTLFRVIKDDALRSAILADYPEFQIENTSPPKGLTKPKDRIGKEREGKEEAPNDEKKRHTENAKLLLETLNEAAGKKFTPVDSHLTPMIARLSEPGIEPEECEKMILRQVKLWKHDPKMSGHLVPSTLFRACNFQKYYDTRNDELPGARPINGAFDTRGRVMQ